MDEKPISSPSYIPPYNDPPPPYSPYDASKQPSGPIGFEPLNQPPPYSYAPANAPQPNAPQFNQYIPPNAPPVNQIVVVPTVDLNASTTIPLASNTVSMQCPFCHSDISTSVVKEPTIAAYFWSIFLCFLGCVYGCCLIPFFIDSCKDSKHYCPSCKKFLGKYSEN